MTGLTASRAYGLLALRVVTGFYFLWAGLDKLFSWIGGAEPFSAAGFLTFGTAGTTSAAVAEGAIVNPTHQLWVDLASNQAILSTVDVLVPYGQILIGLGADPRLRNPLQRGDGLPDDGLHHHCLMGLRSWLDERDNVPGHRDPDRGHHPRG